MKRFLLLLLLTPAALGATYNVALPGGGVLTVNGLPYVNPGITNSASVVWGVDGTGLLYATATGTNSSIVYVEGAAVAGPNFGLSTEIDPAVTASTNITFSLVNGSITTNKIDTTFYSLLMAASSGSGDVVGPASSTDGNIPVFMGTTGKVLTNSPAIAATNIQTITAAVAAYEPLNSNKYQATNSVLTTLSTLNGAALTNLNATSIASGTLSSNRLPADIALTTLTAGTLTATSVSGDGSGLTNLNGSNIASGTVAAARIDTAIARTNAPTLHSPTLLTPALGVATATSVAIGATNVVSELALKAPLSSPTLASPTLNDTVVFEQTSLSAHSDVTNFVADPSISPYQVINSGLTTAFTGVRFLHATNVAAGRQTTVLVFAGTNAAVSVALNSQFAFNTNLVALTTGQILPISFLGYGSSPTNVIATMGTPYIR